MEKYYLFSNVINVNRSDIHFPNSLNVSNPTEIYRYLQAGIIKSCSMKSHVELDRFIYSLNLLVDSLRGNEYYNAFKIYYDFFMTLTTIDYNLDKFDFDSSVLDFIKCHDFTSIYYNYAVLFGENGNINQYMHYLSLADNEYALNNSCANGYFIHSLIKSKGLALWNIVPHIISDYNNYKTNNNHCSSFGKTIEAFNIDISDEIVNALICDFEYDLLLQFIHIMKHSRSISTSFNFREYHNGNGQYKNIRITRFIGELTWVFEVYLKDKLKAMYPDESFIEPLDGTIKAFLAKIDTDIKKKYDVFQNSLFKRYEGLKDVHIIVNTNGLIDLLEQATLKSEDPIDAFILYLLILKTFRNYYSHYMDRNTNLGASYFQDLTLKLSIFNAFLITKKIFDEELIISDLKSDSVFAG